MERNCQEAAQRVEGVNRAEQKLLTLSGIKCSYSARCCVEGLMLLLLPAALRGLNQESGLLLDVQRLLGNCSAPSDSDFE